MKKDNEERLRLLEEIITNNPEEVKRIIDKVEAMGFEGPTVEEYFESFGGYTEKDLVLNTIKELEDVQDRMIYSVICSNRDIKINGKEDISTEKATEIWTRTPYSKNIQGRINQLKKQYKL